MKYVLAFLWVCQGFWAHAQKHEFGLSLGATNYKGDFTNDNFQLKNYFPGGLLFYKNNITPAVGIRYHALVGGLNATDSKANDPVYVQRDQSFQSIIGEGAAQIEYNFLNYRSEGNPIQWTPYFTGGLGVLFSSGTNKGASFIPCVPVGVGIRCMVRQYWNIGIEAVARKTFTDLLDNVDGGVYAGNSDTNDWYFYNGITFSYTIYNIYCPRPRR